MVDAKVGSTVDLTAVSRVVLWAALLAVLMAAQWVLKMVDWWDPLKAAVSVGYLAHYSVVHSVESTVEMWAASLADEMVDSKAAGRVVQRAGLSVVVKVGMWADL